MLDETPADPENKRKVGCRTGENENLPPPAYHDVEQQIEEFRDSHMFLFFLGFSAINFFSLSFNFFLFLTIHVQNDKVKLPATYIYNMILGNSIDIITLFLTFLLPMCMDDTSYAAFRRTFGPILTLLCSFSYEHPLYLTVLMIVHRIYAVYEPMNKLFTSKKLWVYCGVIAFFSMISLLIPFFSDCPVNINQRTFSFSAACPERHPVTNIQNRYLIVIPLISMILNIGLIFYLATRKGSLFRRANAIRISVVSVSTSSNLNRNRLPPIQRSKNRQKLEKTLLFQSISTTTFLLGYELSGLFIRIFSDEYALLSENVRQFIFYSRISASSLLCFLVYFVGTPSIRSLLIEKFVMVAKGHRELSTILV